MKRGKKTRAWDHTRAKLKKQFFEIGVTTCEECGADNFLSFAHRLKRRFITDEAELATVALLCIPCHEKVERLGHSEMFRRITDIINRRTA